MSSSSAGPTPERLSIAAGVLHYRAWPAVRSTIDGLLAQTRQPDQVVVVDHASGDGSAEEIRKAYPQVDVVELLENRGPAGGMSSLVSTLMEREVDAIFVLTDDTELARDALAHLADRLEREPQVGAVGPVIAHQRERDRVFYAGGDIDPRTWDLQLRHKPERLAEWEGRPPDRVAFLVLSGHLVRREAVRQAGPPSERFYHHWDDVDFSLRVGACGWHLECVPAAVGWLDLGGPAREAILVEPPPYVSVRNRLGVIARHAPRRMVVRELARTVSWLVRDAIRPRSGSRADLPLRLRGMIDFCRGRWGAPPE